MGKFIVFIIIVAGVWYFWTGSEAPVDASQPSADGSPDFSMDGGTDKTQATLANPDNPDVADQFSVDLKEAELTWKTYQQEKTDATLHDKAPTLAAVYSKLLKQTYNKPALKKIQLQIVKDRLEPLAARLFFSSKTYKNDDSGLFVSYAIKQGDRLDDIGRDYGMSFEFINMLRGREANNEIYSVGEDLKLINAKSKGYEMHIDKSDFYMDVFVCDVFIKRYPIGHGAAETDTPSGETYIEARVLHPQWTNPLTKEVFQFGQKGHILGPVWLAFNKEIGKSGLGIHGYTGDGQATGVMASNGCIRMQNDQALELYNIMVKVQTKGGFISRAPMKVVIVE